MINQIDNISVVSEKNPQMKTFKYIIFFWQIKSLNRQISYNNIKIRLLIINNDKININNNLKRL